MIKLVGAVERYPDMTREASYAQVAESRCDGARDCRECHR